MKKKPVINGSILIFVIGAVAGLYFYTKRSIKKIVAAMDDTFDIDNEQENEAANEQPKTKTVKINLNDNYGHIEPINIDDVIKYQVDKWYMDHINTVNLFDGD